MTFTHCKNSHFSFDIENKTWKTIKPMNVARYLGSVAVLNEYIYVVGGIARYVLTNSVELYDPKNDEWIQLPPMGETRKEFALFMSKGFLYALGWNEVIERYDPWKNCWKKVRASAKAEFKSKHSNECILDWVFRWK